MATAVADKTVRFDYTFMPIADMQVRTEEDPKTGKQTVSAVLIQDEPMAPTDRFWVSLYSRYGFNSAFFKYFSHAEVFTRISEVESNDRMRLCIERDETGAGTLLGVSNPSKPIVVYDEIMELLGRYNGESIAYTNGIVESTHAPRQGANSFKCGDFDFVNRFMMATPIDGYGAPNIYLALLNLATEAGVVGYAKAFRAALALGKADDDVTPSLTRALDGFNNDEGYAAIRQRLESSLMSWSSVYEADSLYKLLVKCHGKSLIDDKGGVTSAKAVKLRQLLNAPVDGKVENDGGIGSQLLIAYHRCTGDINRLYGVANLEALSAKRQRTLPVRCTVFDLMMLATEIAAHYANPTGARMLQAWVGNLLAGEFDMEGTKEKFVEFAEFHNEMRAGLAASAAA